MAESISTNDHTGVQIKLAAGHLTGYGEDRKTWPNRHPDTGALLPPTYLYDLVELRRGIDRVMAQHSNLTPFGVGVFGSRRLSREERAAALAKEREDAKSEEFAEEVARALGYLEANSLPGKGWHPTTSYGHKHTAERLAGLYVGNGAIIVAALLKGIGIKTNDGPNVLLRTRFRPCKDEARFRIAFTTTAELKAAYCQPFEARGVQQ
jgi:hypothetical protein